MSDEAQRRLILHMSVSLIVVLYADGSIVHVLRPARSRA